LRKLFLLAALALIVYLQINGEKIPINEGAFGDGVFYRDVARFFLDDIEASKYSALQLTRILPFALLNLSFSAFHIVKDSLGLRNGMIIWQVVYLALSIYWYFRICDKIRAKTPLMTLGFILMFCNFAWLKWFWYSPFSPEAAAFALGMGQVNYFLRYEKYKLGMVSLIGAFVSPLLVVSGVLMFILPGDKLIEYPGERPKSTFPLLPAFGIPLITGVLGWGLWGWSEESTMDQAARVASLILFVALAVWIAKNNPIDWEQSIALLRKKTKLDRVNRGVMALMGIILILVLLSGNDQPFGIIQSVLAIGNGTFRFPLDFILDIGLQWGIAVAFTLVFICRFIEQMGAQGWAVVIIIFCAILFLPYFPALSWAAWVPMWLVILVKSLKQYQWSGKDLISVAFLALLLSLTWLPINSEDLQVWLSMPSTEGSLAVQKLAIHLAPYRSFLAYGIGTVTMSLIILWFLFRKKSYQRSMR
jgi:hypothetical protein